MLETSVNNIYLNDEIVGETGEYVLIGVQAFIRHGLTSLRMSTLQCSTLVTGINGLHNYMVEWYFNPYADRFDHSEPGIVHPNIRKPTEERAVVEYMAYHDYFDEGILIEGIKNYLWRHKDDYTALIEEAKYWKYKPEMVEYWVNEAKEDYDD